MPDLDLTFPGQCRSNLIFDLDCLMPVYNLFDVHNPQTISDLGVKFQTI